VKIKQLLFLFLCCASLELRAQQPTSEKLYPIEQIQQGFRNKFVYKRQVIDNPLALQIPLLEAKDPEISFEFNKFKQQRKLMNWISSIGLGLSAYSLMKPGQVTDGFYLSTVGAAALVNVYVGTVSMRHLKSALKKYNELAGASPQLSLSYKPIPNTNGVWAVEWKYNF